MMDRSRVTQLLNWGLICVLCIVSATLFLVWSKQLYRIGFPLDDAWIHQTYARNLEILGQWAYYPGQASAGSTSPLWTLVLAAGYFLRIDNLIWSFTLGLAVLAVLAILSFRYLRIYLELPIYIAWLSVILLVFEYHLMWAALSGMETLLFGLLLTIILLQISQEKIHPISIGLLIAVCVWIRPDGLTLLGPALMFLFVHPPSRKKLIQNLAEFFGGFLILFIPYLIFNYLQAGSIWPSTLYAKQAEYAVLRQTPLISRLIAEFSLPLIGVGILLSPGFIYFLYQELRKRKWGSILGFIWWFGYIGLYAWRLPVTYQHGRYIIPAMPLYLIWGLAGLGMIVSKPGSRWFRVINKAWVLSVLLVLFGFWFLGAQSYAKDVAVIESEMVDTAKWISQNIPEDSLVAAHDIGALGYFGERQILDLAGLVTPQVIPVITDESRLIEIVNNSGADYLMTFPDWYKHLPDCGEIIFETRAPFSPELGGENMTLYRWKHNCTIP